MQVLRRAFPVLAPLLTLAAIVFLGDWLASQGEGGETWETPELPFEAVAPLPAARGEVELRILDGAGRPAAGAFVALLEPEVRAASAGADGRARLPRRGSGPWRAAVFLPGHEPYWTEPQKGASTEVHLQTLRPLAGGRPEPALRRDLEVLLGLPDPALSPAGILVLARPREDAGGLFAGEGEPPLFGLTAADGRVLLPGAPPGALVLEAYAPGLPPEEPWLLGRRPLADLPEEPLPWSLEAASLELRGLPPAAPVSALRLDGSEPELLPLRLADEDGVLRWPLLPPGRYRLQPEEGEAADLLLRPGIQILDLRD